MRKQSQKLPWLWGFGFAVLSAFAAPDAHVRAQTALQLEKHREQLLVSVMALERGGLIADTTASYTAYHQHKEQVLTLDLELQGQRTTVLITLWDREAGGVLVSHTIVDRHGNTGERREFVMYPLLGKNANRTEPLRLPVMSIVDSGSDQLIEVARIDLQVTMQRIVRRR